MNGRLPQSGCSWVNVRSLDGFSAFYRSVCRASRYLSPFVRRKAAEVAGLRSCYVGSCSPPLAVRAAWLNSCKSARRHHHRRSRRYYFWRQLHLKQNHCTYHLHQHRPTDCLTECTDLLRRTPGSAALGSGVDSISGLRCCGWVAVSLKSSLRRDFLTGELLFVAGGIVSDDHRWSPAPHADVASIVATSNRPRDFFSHTGRCAMASSR